LQRHGKRPLRSSVLLTNFHIPRKSGRIYLYRRGKPVREIGIRRVAQEADYYDLKRDDPEADKDAVDKLLLVSERTAAPIIKNLLSTTSPNLTNDDIDHLAWFAGLLGSRTPAVRETLASIHIGIGSREFKKLLRDEGEFEEIKSRHADMTIEQLEQARKAILNGDVFLEFKRGGGTEDFLMGQQLQFAQILVDIIQNRDWILMETSSSLSFLTSDNPVVNMPVPDHPKSERWGYANGNILLPLSPKRALLFAVRYSDFQGIRVWNRVVEVQRKRMPEIQFYIITQCRSAVYSHVSSKEFQRVLDSTEEGKAQTATVPGA
jgi:hypothetical protein